MTAPLPDAELLTVSYLRTVTGVTDEVGQRVYTELPANPTWPLLVVTRPSPGTVLAEATLDAASIQTAAYANSKYEARQAAAAAVAALADADGWAHASGYISATEPLGGLLWLPDEDFTNPRPRYLFDTAVYVRS